MSSNNIAHISSVDKGLKMKIKRTKMPNKLDSKHEVVKTAAAIASSGVSVNTSSAAAPSIAKPSFSVVSSVSTSRTSGSSGSHTIAASVTATLTFPSSTSLTLSLSSLPSSSSVSFASSSLSSSVATTSLVTMAVTNPTVALLKTVNVGVISDATTVTGKSPTKLIQPGAAGSDSKDGKSQKTKPAYNKKVKDNKMKPDIPVSVGSNLNPVGNTQTVSDGWSCVGMAVGSQPFNSPPPPPPSHTSLSGVINSTLTSEPRPGDIVHMKKENPVHDPYEFNAKVEDKIELPPKKLKLEKADCIETAMSPQPQHPPSPGMAAPPLPSPSQQQQPQKRSVGVDVCSVGVVTEPECLGPCEPGTLVGLEGIVWKETDNGLLVVNVTWRGKTYVGTLMDATRYAWAPPRPNGCESPVSDFESRTPKGRGKRNCRNAAQSSERLPEGRRLRKGRRGTVNSSSCFTAPPSPAKSDISSNNMKRKTRPNEANNDKSKRSRSCSRGLTGAESPTPDDYIVCPEPNCHKKYKHMNGLRYHRTHAHRKSSLTDDAKDEEEEEEEDEDEKPKKKEKTTLSERSERMKAKERMRMNEQQKNSDRDSKDSLDDDIPLKEIAIKVSGQSSSQRLDSSTADTDKAEEDTSASIEFSPSGAAVLTINSTVSATETTFAKPNISSQSNSMPQITESVSESKSNDVHSMDVSSCTVSVVPSVTSTADSPQTLAGYSSSSKMSLPVITCVKSPVHQVSPTATVAAISRISQANNLHGVTVTQTLPVMASPGIQTTPTAVVAVTLSTDRASASKGPGFLKTITSVRPIVPAPSPQTCGMASSHLQNSTSQSSPLSHGPMLKHIQPKPTIMGDYSVVSPALSDLSRDKSRKLKKKKEKDSMGIAAAGQQKPALKVQTVTREHSNTQVEMTAQDDLYKVDRSVMIRNLTPSKPFDTCSPTSDTSKSPFHPLVDSPLVHSPYSDTAIVGGPRLVIPPSTLAVSPNVDQKSTISEDVHSPAYSDISDANDSSSPVQQDSPKKDSSRKLDILNGPPHLTADGHSLSQHYGNMFYYGTPANYLPHGINPHMTSPTLSKGTIKSEYIEESRPPGSDEDPQDKKEETHSFQDSDLQQKSLINYYAHLHNMSPAAVQYQLNLAGFNPATLEQPYTMLTQQTLAAEQKRLLQQDGAVKLEDNSAQTSAGLSSSNQPVASDYEAGRKSKLGHSGLEGSMEQKGIDSKGQHQRDKNSGNLQAMKDNIELKSMGLHQQQSGLPPQDQHNYQLLKQQNDILRAQMYQQQKHKVFENQRQEKRKGPPELTSTGHITSIQSPGMPSRHFPDRATPDTINSDSVRKDIYQNRLDSKLEAADSKRFDIKEENSQLKLSGSSHELSKSRSSTQTGTLNIPPANTMSSVQQSLQPALTSSLPMPLVTPLPTAAAAAAAAFSYAPFYPHYMDTMYRTINPHIIGYAGPAPSYIHPEQLSYRMSTVDHPGRKTADSSEPQRGEVSAMVTGTGYPPVHKIHELHEKGRPSPGVHSPGPAKSAGGDIVNSPGPATPAPASEKVKEKQREYPSSPPTQRHVHTHHHTHVVGGFPSLYPADAYSAMFGHPAAAAAIQTAPHPFPAHPPATPKS